MSGYEPCPMPGCEGDARYSAPGRGHVTGCTYPLNLPPDTEPTTPTSSVEVTRRARHEESTHG